MEKTINNERAVDRLQILLSEDILRRPAQDINTNAPVALYQCAWLNELNGILLGLGLPNLRIQRLPITVKQVKAINKATH